MKRKEKNKLMAVLERHGITDPHAYLDEVGDSAPIGTSSDPDVQMRGSVQLMKNRMVSRRELKQGFARLKYL